MLPPLLTGSLSNMAWLIEGSFAQMQPRQFGSDSVRVKPNLMEVPTFHNEDHKRLNSSPHWYISSGCD
ncbi:Periplakin [Manis javanica]|nr:Periplakin [Manis javanica]